MPTVITCMRIEADLRFTGRDCRFREHDGHKLNTLPRYCEVCLDAGKSYEGKDSPVCRQTGSKRSRTEA